MCTRMCVCVCVCVCVCMCVCVCLCMCVCVCVCVHAHVCVSVHTPACVCVCVCVCMFTGVKYLKQSTFCGVVCQPCRVSVQNVSVERLVEVCEALKDNTVCVHFHMAGVAANDKVGKVTSLVLSADSKTGNTHYMCICTLCTHTHARTHARMHARMHTHTHATHTFMHAYVHYAHTHTHTYVHTHTHTHRPPPPPLSYLFADILHTQSHILHII